MNVGKEIRRARKAKKISKAELARHLDVSRSTVLTWESGGPGPKLDDLPKIARALDTTVSVLLGLGEAKAS